MAKRICESLRAHIFERTRPHLWYINYNCAPMHTFVYLYLVWPGFPGDSVVKNPLAKQEKWVPSLGWEDLLQKGMATHSSILAWKIPWTEDTGGPQFMGSQRVGHDLVTKQQQFSLTTLIWVLSSLVLVISKSVCQKSNPTPKLW